MAERPALTAKSVRIAEDEAKWLSVAAGKGRVSQSDLIRLAVVRLRKELGAASRVKPDAVLAAAKASKFKLSPPRASGSLRRAPSRSPVHHRPWTARPGCAHGLARADYSNDGLTSSCRRRGETR
jgi:hypothetical protein